MDEVKCRVYFLVLIGVVDMCVVYFVEVFDILKFESFGIIECERSIFDSLMFLWMIGGF